jgi:hypothetical protein
VTPWPRVGIDSVIQADFDYVSGLWGSEEILVLDKAAISELLYKVLRDDQTAGFLRSRDVVTDEGAARARELEVAWDGVGDWLG